MKALVHPKQRAFAKFIESTKPEHWPQLDEWPETDVSDLERVSRLEAGDVRGLVLEQEY